MALLTNMLTGIIIIIIIMTIFLLLRLQIDGSLNSHSLLPL